LIIDRNIFNSMHLYVYLNLFGIINNINGEDNYNLIKGK
jgi:hypothetical protein